ncbi:HAD-IIIC family phosphatase [Streptomyces sp. NPDC014656]|uniref:HAD-IIIC family phosphatase n=1 Tax=Streptomyces sp. NPDC014656 TaxID=3364878 RepID=UPI0036FB9EA0
MTSTAAEPVVQAPAVLRKPKRGRVKCIVWDLDHTLWEGVLLEDGTTALREDVVAEIRRLDEAGVLHSIASRNDHEAAMERLREYGVDDLFLHPQINWNAKSHSVREIARALNIGLDAIAFVDDQEFERAEVARELPDVITVDALEVHRAFEREEFRPRFITDESRQRRSMYRGQIEREQAESEFVGPSEQFLSDLGMRLSITRARTEDLQRAEELTIRTNQLNSTGRTYSYEELDALRTSPDHLLLVASLEDRFGSYGKIGVTLIEKGEEHWHLRLLLMSCRVMSRGVGTILLNHLMNLAKEAGVTLRADFVETGRNRMMQIAYAFAGFEEIGREGNEVLMENDLSAIQAPASYVTVITDDGASAA